MVAMIRPFDPAALQDAVDPQDLATRAEYADRPIDITPEALLHAIRCMDLTTLAGDDTAERVRALCDRARAPLPDDIARHYGAEGLTTAAVCVYPAMIPHAVKALEGSGIPVASVAAGFPAGQLPLHLRLAEIEWAVGAGASEIDIVIAREAALTDDWTRLYDETCAMRAACGNAHMKVILATGDLACPTRIRRAAMVVMQAGADVIKTSTGKEAVNATLPVTLVMLDAIADDGHNVGFKPAGGLRSARDAAIWQRAVAERLGQGALTPQRFRIGASSLLDSVTEALQDMMRS